MLNPFARFPERDAEMEKPEPALSLSNKFLAQIKLCGVRLEEVLS